MKFAPPTSDEPERLRALLDFGILDTAEEEDFTNLVELAAQLCKAPFSLITLVDERRQWFKARVGLGIRETSRDVSFCGHAIHGRDMMIVHDTTEDDRFSDNPFVVGEPHIRFYAGMPLVTRDGYQVGTLCVLDSVPRPIVSPDQMEALRILSRQVMRLMELRQSHALQQESLQTAAHFRILVEQSRDAIISINTNGTIRSWNEGATASLGWPSASTLGKHYSTFLRSNVGEDFLKEVRTALRDRGVWRGEVALLDAWDHPKEALISVSPITVGQESGGYLLQAHDISERKRLEAELLAANHDLTNRVAAKTKEIEQEKFLSDSIINSLPGIFYLFNERGKFLRWNRGFETASGYSGEEIERMHPLDFFDAGFQPRVAAAIFGAMREGQATVEADLKTKSRVQIPYIFNGFAVNYNHELCLVGVGIDISELTQYRQGLEQMVEERTTQLQELLRREKETVDIRNKFITVASHEFRTPLSTITLSAGLLRKFRHKMSDADITKKFDHIEQQVEHLAQLLEDVLTVGKIDTGKWVVKFSEIQLQSFIQDLIREVTEVHPLAGPVTFEWLYPETHFRTDEKLLLNIAHNLLTNAVKFSAPHGPITIKVSSTASDMVLVVKDQGIGIHPADLPKLFDPFVRGENATDIPGTGLGLSVVRQSAELLRGTVKVISKLGEGSEFIVQLPRN